MCWNYEVSISTGIFSYATALIIYNRNYGYDRWLALFILSFSTIQFLEAIIWKNIDKDNNINHYITKYAIPFVLASEGVVALYGASMYTEVSYEMFITYFIFALIIFIICMEGFNKTSLSVDGCLKWNDGNYTNIFQGLLFLMFIAAPFWLYMNDDNLTKFIILTGMVTTLIYSVIMHKQSWQSNWCLFANATNGFLLLRPYL